MDIGKYLIEVKQRLGHGEFYKWIDAEFGWSDRTAVRFMSVAKRFESVSLSEINILPTALYQLSAPSTPREATLEAIERAQLGEKITDKTAKAIKAKYVPAKEPTKETVPPQNVEQSARLQAETQDKEAQKNQRTRSLPVSAGSPSASLPPEKIEKTKQSILAVYPTQKAVRNSWWQLGENHQLFCGEPKSSEFLERLPQAIALTINFPPHNDSSLVPPINSDSNFTYHSKYGDIDISSVRKMVENCICCSTEARDIVVFAYIFEPQLLEMAEQLSCSCYLAEPDLNKCEQLLAIWRAQNSVRRI